MHAVARPLRPLTCCGGSLGWASSATATVALTWRRTSVAWPLRVRLTSCRSTHARRRRCGELLKMAAAALTRARARQRRRLQAPHARGPLLGPGLPPARGPWPAGPPRGCSNASSARPPPPPPPPQPWRHACFGEVPPYLDELAQERLRQAADAEAAALAAAQAALTPPGCRLLSEAERYAGTRLLRAAHADALAEAAAFPLAINSAWRVRARSALDDRIARLEEALLLFGRPLVFLPIDAGAITADEGLPA